MGIDMCDPMIGLMVSAGSALINYQQQSDVMSQQQAANDAWVAYQQDAQRKEAAADEAARQKAESARQTSLTDVNAGAQKQQQATEQQRLTDYLTPQSIKQSGNDPNQTPGDLLLSGQQYATPEVQQQIAGQLNQAAQDARSRIAALATMQSYGGSQFGLTPTVNQAFQTSGQQIQLQGDIRQGDLAVLQAARNVQPLHIVATPSPWGGIASALAGAAGKGFGGGMGGLV
jgi:hypothetical protein